MASILQFATILLLAMVSVDARPCKTFFISSYSISLHRPQSPNSPFRTTSSEFVTVFTEISRLKPSSSSPDFFFPSVDNSEEVEFEVQEERPSSSANSYPQHLRSLLPAGFSYDFASLRDRTKDILSVVVALLFGVGCGALTAATMYLAYSLLSNRESFYDDYGDDDEEDSDEDASDIKKRMGYVKIPDDYAPAQAKAVV